MREWFKENGGPLALVVLGLAIGGWTSGLAGAILVIVGLASWIALRLIIPRLPWEIVRKQQQPPRSSLPMPHLPLWLNPLTSRKQAANILLEEGYNLLKSLPAEAPNPLHLALAGVAAQQHEKLLAQWEGRVVMFLNGRATECTALFHPSPGIPGPAGGPAFRKYLTDRLDELKAIHAQL